ncbi:MAG: bacterial regulatory s, gntR family protein [Alphaproteobacteria bacterium]|nr:bacterial regulatory s, gntR family protein [Alphaproteobacteria bacterium]MDB5719740.1 bacterial regulatory s, gntR family protein [Alphaproteobacteria bacterium]
MWIANFNRIGNTDLKGLSMATGGKRDSEARRPREDAAPDRLYQRLARQVFDDLAAGKYKVGDRLPAERELAAEHEVSRPAVREAMISLEVQGLVEVRIGSGAYVKRLPGSGDRPGFHATAFELTEARMLIEGEAAALAASHISDEELDALDRLVEQIAEENLLPEMSVVADHAFHRLIAGATRNAVIADSVERLWEMRSNSPECALLHEKARDADVRPVVDEHRLIAEALRRRDPAAAREAMRAHLSQVMDYLLFATEERAIAEARRAVASTRARYGRSAAF